MFKKFITSLSKPQQTIFFLTDSWFRVIGYLLTITLIISVPPLIKLAIKPEMDMSTYEELKSALKSDWVQQPASIVDGTLTMEGLAVTDFGGYNIYLGERSEYQWAVNFVFGEKELKVYVRDIPVSAHRYETLALENYDFNTLDNGEITKLSVAIKTVYEKEKVLLFGEIFGQYFLNVLDYVFVAFMLTIAFYFFNYQLQMNFTLRFKFAFYLSSIYVVMRLLLSLFNLEALNPIAVLITALYHFVAFRAIKLVPRGGE